MTADNGAFVPVWDLNETPVDGPVAIVVSGRELVLFRHHGGLVVMDRWCPHQTGDMAQGHVVGKALKCPVHGFMFSVGTGRGLNCPGFSVSVHDLSVKDGIVGVRLRQ